MSDETVSNPKTFEMSVSGSTNAKQLAGSIRARYRSNPDTRVVLLAMGMAAVNAAVKGVIELNKLLSSQGVYATALPTFEDRLVQDRYNPDGPHVERTMTFLYLHKHSLGS